ncbi:CRISPR-associated helicase Cas3' [Vreelandella zhaodongensis]|uniref:CRISPR-associated helicase Cas3 n=1 Tax=Vreelandella zhaodongensis TaxID=1176240 RepID=A0ABX2SUV1_VREZH|nr:CRISPR-associated helicase Cas3' [Halomonas zhaodongensis]NYS45921.1 CRISPR-associated helicase Cas3' [Halomonas zhaodongensis]
MLRKKSKSVSSIEVKPYAACPAKSFTASSGCIRPGRSVESHCQIVGEVAKELIHRFPLQGIFPKGSAYLAATHDIGKVSPTFFNKIMRACSLERVPNANPDLERAWGGHAGVSQATAKAMGAPEYVPEILGQHHGFSPNLAGKRADAEVFGGTLWQKEREKLAKNLSESLDEDWPQIESVAQARLLAGLTSVADWIGSGHHFEDPEAPWEEKITQALDDAGFVPVSYQQNLSFEQVFGFAPRLAQSTLIEQASRPGVYVFEAPMGLGKTEAALYAAYKMLANGQASGIYFALPTQLTSNKIFERFQGFLASVLADECHHRSLLLHANAWLFDTELGEEGRPGGAWFNQSKRGLLAPFAVGTIDQALMAAMNVKHGFVRAFGLAGKVVILDEIHTYDAYTSTLLDALVSLLRELHCTVIILSATLNQERRQGLLKRSVTSIGYPLITASHNEENMAQEVSVPAGKSSRVEIVIKPDEATAIEHVLLCAEQGQQVLWIENTVKDAQQRYLDIAARAADLGVACGLLHSRFTANDRQQIEDKWVSLFGKSGWQDRQKQGRILVGTQVLEQSLDIDADFMVTRFAPTDMLLQRLGRLWRHSETPRCSEAKPKVWVLAPALDAAIEAPETHFGASAYVYSPYVLCRSLEVWQDIKHVNLPKDIRGLIERTYCSRTEKNASMSRWLRDLEEGNRHRKGLNALRQLARIGLSEGGNTLPESKAQTRYSESESYEVLLLKAMTRNRTGDTATLTLLNGEQLELPLQRHKLTKPEWRQRTAVLMRQIVNVPQGDKPNALSMATLKSFGLGHCFYLGNPDWPEDESLLRVALVDASDRLQGVEHNDVHDKHALEYRDDLGYRVIKNRGK